MSQSPEVNERIAAYAHDALNRVGKWRTLLTGWQLGTRPKGDPEGDAVRDLQEARLLLRVEVNALAGLLIKKGVFSALEWTEQLAFEAEAFEAVMEARFPGITATVDGLHLKLPEALETMRRYRFKP